MRQPREDGTGAPTSDLTSLHVRRAVGGDATSLEWVVAHFDPLVEAQVRFRLGGARSDVRDVVNDVWLVALPRLGELREAGGRLAPVLAKFLGTTAINKCNNHLKRHIRRRVMASGGEDEAGAAPIDRLADDTLGVITRAAQGEVRTLVADVLERLGRERREVLVLRLLEQRTNTEIGAILGLDPNTVAQRVRRALGELRERLPKAVFEEFAELGE